VLREGAVNLREYSGEYKEIIMTEKFATEGRYTYPSCQEGGQESKKARFSIRKSRSADRRKDASEFDKIEVSNFDNSYYAVRRAFYIGFHPVFATYLR
jgi:hypothetical protein